jgi:hypothetical protein
MNLLIYVIPLAILAIGFFIWDFMFNKRDKFTVRYSEILNNKEIEHVKTYTGVSDKGRITINIRGLGLQRPYPASEFIISTNSKDKIIHLVKFDELRYMYKTPAPNDEIYVPKRDENGNVIKINEKISLVKKPLKLCDDYSEPNTKHWERVMNEQQENLHSTKSKWESLFPVIGIAIMFLFGVIALKMTIDNSQKHVEILSGKIEAQQNLGEKLLNAIQAHSSAQANEQTLPSPDNEPQNPKKNDNIK